MWHGPPSHACHEGASATAAAGVGVLTEPCYPRGDGAAMTSCDAPSCNVSLLLLERGMFTQFKLFIAMLLFPVKSQV